MNALTNNRKLTPDLARGFMLLFIALAHGSFPNNRKSFIDMLRILNFIDYCNRVVCITDIAVPSNQVNTK